MGFDDSFDTDFDGTQGMPDSKQLQIIKAVTAILERINPTNVDLATGQPYEFDMRSAVYRGRGEVGANDPAHTITILESPRPIPTDYPAGEQLNHKRVETLTLLVQGFVPQLDDQTGDNAYEFKAQCEQLLSRVCETNPSTGGGSYPQDYLLGKVGGKYLVSSFTIQTGGVRPPAKGVSPTAFFYLPLVIKFAFNPANPYA